MKRRIPRKKTGAAPRRQDRQRQQQQQQQQSSLEEFKKKFNQKRLWRYTNLLGGLLILYIFVIMVRSYDYIIIPLYNLQMEPNFNPTERYFGKEVQDYDAIERDSVVYYDFPYRTLRGDEEPFFMARVIGIEGDRIALKDGKAYRNGEPLQELYTSPEHLGKENFPDILVPRDHVYLLIDKRYDRRPARRRGLQYRDSRHWGPIFKYAIQGVLEK